MDLSSYAGQNVVLEFEFDSKDKHQNNYLGWIVDNIVVSIDQAPDANGNLSIAAMANCQSRIYFETGASDNCTVDTVYQTSGLPSGSIFPAGTTTNSFVAIDASGNTATCTFDVVVADLNPPAFSNCPVDITSCNAVISWTPPTATDECGAVNIIQTAGPTPGSSFSYGSHTITYEATDAAGNTSSCSFVVTRGDLTADAGDDQVVYQGYGSCCTLLYATGAGGDGNYTYNWSNGDTTPYTWVCPNSTTTYTVTITDGTGCSGTDQVMVEVKDISCGQNNVTICYQGNTYCVNSYIAFLYTTFSSATLGPCGNMAKNGNSIVLSETDLLNNHPINGAGKQAAGFSVNAYPNPFTESATIEWTATAGEHVSVTVYDITGKLVSVLANGTFEGSQQSVSLDAGGLAPGIYTIRITAGSETQSLPLILNR